MSEGIFAHHAHVFPQSVWAEGTPDALLKVMDACSIDRCVAFAPFSRYVGDLDANDWLARQLAARPRLAGFGVINMAREDMEDQVQRIDELGLQGIKLHPAFQGFAVMGDKARRVYAKAEELGLALTFHTGIHWHRIRDYDMLLFDEVAWHYPKLRFSMEHMGGYCFFNQALAVLLNNRTEKPRVYAGMTSVCDRDMNRFWHLSDEQIRDILWQAGADLMIFGLDFPYNGEKKIKEAMARFERLGLGEEAMRGLYGANLRRLIERA